MQKTKMTKQILLMLVLLCVTWPLLAFAGEVNLPQTGQTTCYDADGNVIPCAGTGQDGDIRAGVKWQTPRFKDNGNGTITDNLTGLIWLKNVGCEGYFTWDNAVKYCNNLASGSCGLTDGSVAGDWRLPNIVELESLVNAERSNLTTWLNSQGFSTVEESDIFWSATTTADERYTDYAMDVDADGIMYHCPTKYSRYVLPVRVGQCEPLVDSTISCRTRQTGQKTSYATGDDGDFEAGVAWPSSRFEDKADGTVTDHLTGLIWLKNANCAGAMTWNNALNFCNNLSSGSYGLTDGSVLGDWRLPNRKELLSLIDYGQYNPPLPQGQPFINVQSVRTSDYYSATYWSSTTYVCPYDTDFAWIVQMDYGFGFIHNKAYNLGYVWPVRGGQSGQLDPLSISYPNDGQTLRKGIDYTISWNGKNVSGKISIALYKGGTEAENMVLQVANATDNDGEYSFKPSDSLEDGSDYYIKISAEGGAVWSYVAVSIKGIPVREVGAVDLPKTGQTFCYDENGNVIDCEGTGQDGDIQAGVKWPTPRFKDNGDGTVTDRLTGLIWLKNADCAGNLAEWDNAVTYCNNLASGSCGLKDGSVAGDWRLPNVVELESLINAKSSNPATWLNSQGFTGVKSSGYWSSSNPVDGPPGWIVYMNSGRATYNDTDEESGNGHVLVWPVRGGQSGSPDDLNIPCRTWQTGQKTSYASGDDGDLEKGVAWPSPRFRNNNNGTITDRLTGLVWLEDAGVLEYSTWSQALLACKNLASGSDGLTDGSVAGDWRLPNRKELLSLVDCGRYDPSLPKGHPFLNAESEWYWSATTNENNTGSAWVVDMYLGNVESWDKIYEDCYIWPVRGGMVGLLGDLTISYPNGGETLAKGSNYTITWQSTDVTGSVELGLYKGGTGSGNMILQLSAGTDNDGQYTFKPASTLEDGSDYYIGISAEEGAVTDFSNSAFSIVTPPDAACMSQKLKTASTLCTALINCWAKKIKDVKGKYEVKDFTGLATQKFETSWGKAQDKANDKGLNCDAGSQDEIGEMINDAIEDIYDYIFGVTGQGNKDSITLGGDLLKVASKRCSSLLNARSAYIKDKSAQRDAKLSTAIAKANTAFSNSFNKAKAKAAKKALSCDDSIKTYLEGAIDDLEADILSGMGIPLP